MDFVCEPTEIAQVFMSGGESVREGGNEIMETCLKGYGLVM